LVLMSPLILALAAAGVGCVVAAVVGGFVLRHAWIERKIAALTGPPAATFSAANADLPAKGGRLRVVLIGDSSLARWPAALLSGRWQFVNRGVGGKTVGQVAQRFETDALGLSPDVVVVSAGANDLIAAGFLDSASQRAVIDRTSDTLIDLAGRAKARGVRILIATIPPPSRPDVLRLPVWRDSVRASVAEVNRRLRQASAQTGVELVDLSAALDSGDRRTPDAFRADAMHLNAKGYERLAQALYAALEH
jgi:lysophospholipase L1-like esterase